jgi:hypothetical protein
LHSSACGVHNLGLTFPLVNKQIDAGSGPVTDRWRAD